MQGDDAARGNPWLAFAWLLAGVGFFVRAWVEWRAYRTHIAPRGAAVVIPGRVVPSGAAVGRLSQVIAIQRADGPAGTARSFKGPITKREKHIVHSIEERVGYIKNMIRAGSEKPAIKNVAASILRQRDGQGNWRVAPKDYDAEADALFRAVVDPRSPVAVRYTRDHPVVDEFTEPDKSSKLGIGDCLPEGTLLLTTTGFTSIEGVHPGDVIMGDGSWTRVTARWDKGTRPTLALELNTGGSFRCTAEHRLFVVSRRGERGGEVECLAGDVAVGDRLLTPPRFPPGSRHLSADDAWLLGTFVADGWVVHDVVEGRNYTRRVGIAGKDGHPKEAQKHRVKAIAEAHGWKATQNARYVALFPDPDWLATFLNCGRRAFNKRLPWTDFDPDTAREVLKGLAADASIANTGTLTYGTTSGTLALQIRVLHRVLGQRTNIRRVDEHGGLGTHPIYRVSLIRSDRADGQRPNEFAIVKDVADGGEAHVYDIETESHRFYLPEHDIVVHNCDDLVSYLGSLMSSVGFRPELVVMQAKGESDWSHILLRYREAGGDGVRRGALRVRYLDPSMQSGRGWMPPGWEPPGLSQVLATGQPHGITLKARVFPVWA